MPKKKGEPKKPRSRIVDKRAATKPEQPPQEEPQPEAEQPAQGPGEAELPEQEPAAAGEELPLEPIDVYSLVRYCMGLLHAHAWQAMGLIVNPITHTVDKDLEQARVAIDCMGFLFERTRDKLAREEARQFQGLLADLRVNFVEQQRKEEQVG